MTTRRCENCVHWSAVIAKSDGGGTVKALCESPRLGLLAGKYTGANQLCSDWTAPPTTVHHQTQGERA